MTRAKVTITKQVTETYEVETEKSLLDFLADGDLAQAETHNRVLTISDEHLDIEVLNE